MTKKILKNTVLALGFVIILFSNANYAKAQLKDYNVLAPLPNTTKTTCNNGTPGPCTDFATYLPNMFYLIIGVAAGLAFIMITIGGITYATSDALQNKDDGKRYVTNAVYGLLLVLGSYIILFTINPEILKLNIVIDSPQLQATLNPTVTTPQPCCSYTKVGNANILNGYTLTAAEISTNKVMVNDLNNSGVEVNHNSCDTGLTSGCTNIVGLPPNAISSVKALKNSCGISCLITINGGTEGGHSDHGPGKAVIDLAPTQELNAFLGSKGNPPFSTPKDGLKVNVWNGTYTYEEKGANGRASGNHWHVEYR
jgi:hypothetical protein